MGNPGAIPALAANTASVAPCWDAVVVNRASFSTLTVGLDARKLMASVINFSKIWGFFTGFILYGSFDYLGSDVYIEHGRLIMIMK